MEALTNKFSDLEPAPINSNIEQMLFQSVIEPFKAQEIKEEFKLFIENVNSDRPPEKKFTENNYDERFVAQPFFSSTIIPYLNNGNTRDTIMIDIHNKATLGRYMPDCAISRHGSKDNVHFLCLGDIKKCSNGLFSAADKSKLFDYSFSMAFRQNARFKSSSSLYSSSVTEECQILVFLTDVMYTQFYLVSFQKCVISSSISVTKIENSLVYAYPESINVLKHIVCNMPISSFGYDLPSFSVNESPINILSNLGSGSTGFVVKGEYQGQMVAIKQFHRQYKQYCVHESNVLSHLNGVANVAQLIHRSGDDFIVTQQVGVSLSCHSRHYIHESIEHPFITIDHLIQLVKILKDIHLKDVIHRDLKPSNLIIYNLSINLIDFGCAYLAGSIIEYGMYNGCKIFSPDEHLLGQTFTPSIIHDLMSVVYLFICILDHSFFDKLIKLRNENLLIISLRHQMIKLFNLSELVNTINFQVRTLKSNSTSGVECPSASISQTFSLESLQIEDSDPYKVLINFFEATKLRMT